MCFISISSDISINISSEEVEDSEEEEGDDTEEEGAEDDEDEDGDEDEDAVDEEEKSTDEGQAEGEGLSTATRPKRKQPLAADNSIQVGKADKRRRNSVQLQAVEVQKEYWGPPKPHRHSLTQRLYTVKFDDGSIQVVLAEDTLNSKAVVDEQRKLLLQQQQRFKEQVLQQRFMLLYSTQSTACTLLHTLYALHCTILH